MIIRAVDAGRRTIDELVTLTGVSAISIRRDLAELAERGALRRVRGGAVAAPRRGAAYPFGLRQAEDAERKADLARVAASLVAPGDSVLVDNGTTALAVAVELAGLGITAMALSLHAAAALASKPGNEVLVPGGPIDHDDLAFSGSSAVDAIRGMHFDIAIFGACAADPEAGLTVANWGDAQVKRAVLASARRSVLVATADTFERIAAHRFGGVGDLDSIVTTPDLGTVLRRVVADAGVDVLTAGAHRT